MTPGTAAYQASLSFTPSLFKFMPIELVMPSNHLILCLFLLLLPPIFPSIRVFSNELALHMRWPKNWSFSFSIISSNEYSGLIPFMIYWFDLLAIQGTLKNLLQHHSSKASIFWHSTFFMVQLSHPYMTTGKTIALTIWTFVSAFLICFLGFFIAFLPRSKHLLISRMQSPSMVILELKKIKSVTASTFYPLPYSDGTRCHDLSFLNVEF